MPFLINRKRFLSAYFLTAASLCLACGDRSPGVGGEAVPSPAEYAVNINTASADELTRIPHIGDKLAAKIVEYRELNGPFRRVEYLMLIQGISDERFRKIRPLVRVE